MTEAKNDEDLFPKEKTAKNSKKKTSLTKTATLVYVPAKRKIKRATEQKSVVLLTSSQQTVLKKLLKQVA